MHLLLSRKGQIILAASAVCASILTGCGSSGSASGTAGGPSSLASDTNTAAKPNFVVSHGPGGVPDLGIGASLHGKFVFPTDNPWNTPIDTMARDPNSDNIVANIGLGSHLHPDFGTNPNYGIPYIIVAGSTPKVPMTFMYDDQSDPGPYPIPSNAPIEGGASSTDDRHVIVIDRDNWKLYETWKSKMQGAGWHAGSGAIFNLASNAVRPAGWTSADAAGLPIFPGLVRYDEIIAGSINHAIRFTVPETRAGYIYPARHLTGDDTDPNLPPMGMRVRLKASVNISGYPIQARIILTAMKKYGMMVADNGSAWYFQGASDSRWDDDQLDTMKQLTGNDFEVVKMGTVTGP